MKKKTILFLIAAIAVYIFFYSQIPVPLVHDAKFFWAFIGGIATGVCIFLAGRKTDEERYNIETYSKAKTSQGLMIAAAVFVGIIGSVIIAFHYYTREDAFIKKNPIIVDGKIESGVSTTQRNSTSYEVTINYTDTSGHEHAEVVSISSKEWDNVGVDMPVKVAYEKDNPTICKLLLNPKEAMDYIGAGKKLYPGLNDLVKILQTSDSKATCRLLGEGWIEDKSDSLTDLHSTAFHNPISGDTYIVTPVGSFYVNENDQNLSYKSIMAEAIKNMKIVYDSMSTNKRKGLELQNDSIRIRFQEYEKMEEKKGDYGIVGMSMKKIYCFGFARKNGFIFLPGDVKEDEDTSADKLSQLLKDREQ